MFLDQLFKPSLPTKEIAEEQHAKGEFERLKSLREMPRYTIIAGWIKALKPTVKILDIGCGEDILLNYLHQGTFSKYVGVDWSKTAIRKIPNKYPSNIFFIEDSAEDYEPNEQFDVIIFNETLYYFKDWEKILKKYSLALKEDGIFIVSMYVGRDSKHVLKKIDRVVEKVHQVKVEGVKKNGGKIIWVLKMIKPLK